MTDYIDTTLKMPRTIIYGTPDPIWSVGQTVLRYRDHHDKTPRTEVIARVMKRFVVLETGEKFGTDGAEWGGAKRWFHTRIEPLPVALPDNEPHCPICHWTHCHGHPALPAAPTANIDHAPDTFTSLETPTAAGRGDDSLYAIRNDEGQYYNVMREAYVSALDDANRYYVRQVAQDIADHLNRRGDAAQVIPCPPLASIASPGLATEPVAPDHCANLEACNTSSCPTCDPVTPAFARAKSHDLTGLLPADAWRCTAARHVFWTIVGALPITCPRCEGVQDEDTARKAAQRDVLARFWIVRLHDDPIAAVALRARYGAGHRKAVDTALAGYLEVEIAAVAWLWAATERRAAA